ncbi:MAG: type II toxin-antitoxin system death-on-curing family toxin [Planctomycetota bacterium]
MANVRFLTWEEMLELHRRSLEAHGGQDGMIDAGLVESAWATPMATFGGHYLHEDIAAMAAAYLFHISENQGFCDGNKRTAVAACLVFLKLNGIACSATNDELYELTMSIAAHRCDKQQATEFLRAKSESLDPDNKQDHE